MCMMAHSSFGHVQSCMMKHQGGGAEICGGCMITHGSFDHVQSCMVEHQDGGAYSGIVVS